MNFFRSEEHARRWAGYSNANDDGLISLADLRKLRVIPYFTARLGGNWMSHLKEYRKEMMQVVMELGKSNPLWGTGPK